MPGDQSHILRRASGRCTDRSRRRRSNYFGYFAVLTMPHTISLRTMTNSKSQGGFVSDTLNDSVVTCPSCEYRYPQRHGTCVMCGTPAPMVEALQQSAALDEFSPVEISTSHSQRKSAGSAVRTLLPVFAASVLLVFASLLNHGHNGNPHTSGVAATQVIPVVEQSRADQINPQHIFSASVRRVPPTVPVSLITVQKETSQKQGDPMSLWNAVRRGNVGAEVTLANLYLRGDQVPQNCEQAHMLLLAASTRGNKLAQSSLKSDYAEHCK